MSESRRRSSDHGWRRFVRENGYRDFWLAAITIVLVLIAAKAFDTSQVAARNEHRTHAALCTFLRDLKQRVDASNAFLAKHPEGFAGIPAATIRQSVTGQERTIKALSGLGCKRR